MVVPGIMNSFIAIFKDTSLVTIVSLYELTGATVVSCVGGMDMRSERRALDRHRQGHRRGCGAQCHDAPGQRAIPVPAVLQLSH